MVPNPAHPIKKIRKNNLLNRNTGFWGIFRTQKAIALKASIKKKKTKISRCSLACEQAHLGARASGERSDKAGSGAELHVSGVSRE